MRHCRDRSLGSIAPFSNTRFAPCAARWCTAGRTTKGSTSATASPSACAASASSISSNGHQPVSNEDGSVWIVFNGEIYNYQELRRDLIARGHSFRTNSDTETIVHLYEEYGAGCVDYLRGMFGFAIWNTRTREMLLARDRLGIKPLYYAERERRAALRVGAEADPADRRRTPLAQLAGGRPPVHVSRDARRPEHRRRREEARTRARCGRARRASAADSALLGRRVRSERDRDRRRARRAAARDPERVGGAPPGQRRSRRRLPQRRHRFERDRRNDGEAGRGPPQDLLDRFRRSRLRRARARADRGEAVRHRSLRPGAAAGRRADRRGPHVVSRRAVRRYVGDPDLHGVEAGGRAREGRAQRRRRRRALRRLRQIRRRRP